MIKRLFNCVISVGSAVKILCQSQILLKVRLTKPNKIYTTVTWQDDEQLLRQYYVHTHCPKWSNFIKM